MEGCSQAGEVVKLEDAIEKENNSKKEINPQATLWRLYGDPKYKDETMVHKWCFSTQELVELTESIGLKDVIASEPEYHHPQVDMRIVGTK